MHTRKKVAEFPFLYIYNFLFCSLLGLKFLPSVGCFCNGQINPNWLDNAGKEL